MLATQSGSQGMALRHGMSTDTQGVGASSDDETRGRLGAGVPASSSRREDIPASSSSRDARLGVGRLGVDVAESRRRTTSLVCDDEFLDASVSPRTGERQLAHIRARRPADEGGLRTP